MLSQASLANTGKDRVVNALLSKVIEDTCYLTQSHDSIIQYRSKPVLENLRGFHRSSILSMKPYYSHKAQEMENQTIPFNI